MLLCRYRLTNSMKTYAWIRATANSKIVTNTKTTNVRRALVILILLRARVAPPIRWINRWPVVMVVSCTARAMGWINRLMVLIIINMGIRGSRVPVEGNVQRRL